MMRPGLPFLLGRAIASVLVVGVVSACGDDGASLAAGGGGAAGTSATGSSGASTSTANGTGAGGGAPGDCTWAEAAFPSDTCGACMATTCCDVLDACDADSLCQPALRCLAACDRDPGCIDACALEHPQQPPTLFAIGECLVTRCPEACPPSCADLITPPDARDDEACDSCMHSACCDEAAAQATPGFLGWAQCTQQCADALCLRECELAYPGATDIASAMNRCVFDEPCGESCARPPTENDTCAGFQIGNPTCAECAREACCAADEACAFDVSCLNAFVCVLDCYDVPSCRTCYEAWPAETMGRVLVVDGCVSAGCTEACDSDGCGNTKHLTSLACDTCTREACCAEQGACTDDAACAGLLVCTTICDGDAACIADCEGLFPVATAEHDALRACQVSSCAEECGT